MIGGGYWVSDSWHERRMKTESKKEWMQERMNASNKTTQENEWDECVSEWH